MAPLSTRKTTGLVPLALASGLGLATAAAGLATPAYATGTACSALDASATMPTGGVCQVAVTTAGSSTWKVPSGVTSIDVLTVGGGGGGGGAKSGYSAGGGGGGGQLTYCREAVTPADTLAVAVGAGGTGGKTNVSTAVPATSGGATSVHDSTHAWSAACSASGGQAGQDGTGVFDFAISGPSGDGGGSGAFTGGAATSDSGLGAGGGAGSAANGGDASRTTDTTTVSDVTINVGQGGAGGTGKGTASGLFTGSGAKFGGGGGGGASGWINPGGDAQPVSYGLLGKGWTAGGGGSGAGYPTTPPAAYFTDNTADCSTTFSAAVAGTANAGGGGGGGTFMGCWGTPYSVKSDGASGGSGVVLVRWVLPGATAFTIPQNTSHQTDVFALAVGGFVPVSAHVVTGPKHGTVAKTSASVFTYSPNADYYGTDVYTVALVNAAGVQQLITVNVTITHVLPATGAEGVVPLGLTGGALLLLGGLAMAAARRRRV